VLSTTKKVEKINDKKTVFTLTVPQTANKTQVVKEPIKEIIKDTPQLNKEENKPVKKENEDNRKTENKTPPQQNTTGKMITLNKNNNVQNEEKLSESFNKINLNNNSNNNDKDFDRSAIQTTPNPNYNQDNMKFIKNQNRQ